MEKFPLPKRVLNPIQTRSHLENSEKVFNSRLTLPYYQHDYYSILKIMDKNNAPFYSLVFDEYSIVLGMWQEVLPLSDNMLAIFHEPNPNDDDDSNNFSEVILYGIYNVLEKRFVTDFEFDTFTDFQLNVIAVHKPDIGWGLMTTQGEYLLECDTRYKTANSLEFRDARKRLSLVHIQDEMKNYAARMIKYAEEANDTLEAALSEPSLETQYSNFLKIHAEQLKNNMPTIDDLYELTLKVTNNMFKEIDDLDDANDNDVNEQEL